MFRKFLRTTENEKKPTRTIVPAQPTPACTPEHHEVAKKGVRPKRPIKMEKVEKAKKIEEEEVEEFEKIEGAKPALCHGKKQTKLKWKKEEKWDKSQHDDSSLSGDAESPPSPSLHRELHVEPFKDVVADLTLEKQKLKETIERLRKRIKRRDNRIEYLTKQVKRVETTEKVSSTDSASSSNREHDVEKVRREMKKAKAQLTIQAEDAEKKTVEFQKAIGEAKKACPSPVNASFIPQQSSISQQETDLVHEEIDNETFTTATRILAVLEKNQLLEKALPPKETAILFHYFSSGSSSPSTEVLALLDKAIGTGIQTLISRPQDLEDPIDNQMRQLLVTSNRAKEILLEVMLERPNYLPLSWGGKTLLLAQSTRQHNTYHPPKKISEKAKENDRAIKSIYLPVKK